MLYSRYLWAENAGVIRPLIPAMYTAEIKNFYSISTFTTDFFCLKCMSDEKYTLSDIQLNTIGLKEKVTLKKWSFDCSSLQRLYVLKDVNEVIFL